MDYPFKELVCYVCGKTFVPAPFHIYNEERKGKLNYICGYNCNCEFNRKNPKKRRGEK